MSFLKTVISNKPKDPFILIQQPVVLSQYNYFSTVKWWYCLHIIWKYITKTLSFNIEEDIYVRWGKDL